MEPPRLGDFEYLVLLALFRVGPEAYGAGGATRNRDAHGSSTRNQRGFTTLERLEQRGSSGPGSANRRRSATGVAVCFELRPLGARALKRCIEPSRR